jgi:hypothetical protein
MTCGESPYILIVQHAWLENIHTCIDVVIAEHGRRKKGHEKQM